MCRALVLVLLLMATATMAQHRSMQLVLPCRDVQGYTQFLQKFGFSTMDSLRDIAHLTDGQIFLAVMRMEDTHKEALALFVDDLPHLDTVLSMWSGVNAFREENGTVNEIDVKAPGGLLLYIHQSEQGSRQVPAMTINPACGAFVEFTARVTNLDSAVAFWRAFGFEQTYSSNSPHPMSRVSNGSFSIGLHLDPNTESSITYASKSAAQQIEAIRARGVEPILSNDGKDGSPVMASFQAPEGLIINILGLR
jgi:hypothetical protein